MRRDASTRKREARPSLRSWLPAAVASLGMAGAGCEGLTTLQLSWRFTDGRDCATAGANKVNVFVDSNKNHPQFACHDGEIGAVSLPNVPTRAALQLAALTPLGTTLYRGDLTLDGSASPGATALLYFNDGR